METFGMDYLEPNRRIQSLARQDQWIAWFGPGNVWPLRHCCKDILENLV